MTNFSDPAYRASLSPEQYERERLADADARTIETVNGHALRYVSSPFGRLIHVGSTSSAFQTIEQARAFASITPVTPIPA